MCPRSTTSHPSLLTTDSTVTVEGANTSGEVEPVLLRAGGRWYLAVGSDHTDRDRERDDIAASKAACPKPIGAHVVRLPDDPGNIDLDQVRARSRVDGTAYQDASLSTLMRPGDVLGRMRTALPSHPLDSDTDFALFGGTTPLLEGTFVPGRGWELELLLPDGAELRHTYDAQLTTTEPAVGRGDRDHRGEPAMTINETATTSTTAAAGGMRVGASYLAALRDDREIYLDGTRVDDVTTHPAFSPAARTIAELYDLAADPGSGMCTLDPQTGAQTNRIYLPPRSPEDLTAFRRAVQTWAEHTHGWMGRTPDHVAAFLSAFASHPETFATDGTRGHDFAANVTAYHRKLVAEQLYVSYAIIPPQVSRADTAHAWEGEFIQAGVVDERPEGLVLRGAQMLATGAAVADELMISCIKPLTDDDRDFAISVVVPVATAGLKLYCRRPYASAASSGYDYPLSTRYDETDALVVLDDVLVPWDRVFVDRDVAGLRGQFFDTGAHQLGNWQAQIRFSVKIEFLAGLGRKIAAVNGVDKFPGVVEKLGELASLAATVESGVLAAEHTAEPDGAGLYRPGRRPLYGAMGLQAELYPRVLAILRDLAGGGVLQVPSSVADLRNPATRADIDRYVQSPGVDAAERIKLFKLVWDAVGSEFAGRHHQYEMFYAGAPFVVKGYAYRNYDFEPALDAVNGFLSSYDENS